MPLMPYPSGYVQAPRLERSSCYSSRPRCRRGSLLHSRWPVPYRFERDLPIRAGLVNTEETTGFPIGTEIEILQAEIGDVLIGFMVVEDEGIGLLKEIELID
jgi:hypothetical protein